MRPGAAKPSPVSTARMRAGSGPVRESGSAGTLAEQALQLLRDDILSGTLAPDTRLRIHALQQHYGLGLSPLREALLRLHGQGLVTSQGQRGFAVAPISQAELQDLTRARISLDTAALAESMALGGSDWEAQVLAANHLLSRTPLPRNAGDAAAARQWEEHHRAFHRALIAGCGSTWLLRLHALLVDHSERYRTLRILHHRERSSQVRDVVAEHAAITDAVLRRDAPRAAELLRSHIGATAEAMQSYFEPAASRQRKGARRTT